MILSMQCYKGAMCLASLICVHLMHCLLKSGGSPGSNTDVHFGDLLGPTFFCSFEALLVILTQLQELDEKLTVCVTRGSTFTSVLFQAALVLAYGQSGFVLVTMFLLNLLRSC